MVDWLAFGISVLSLFVAGVTAWISFLRIGFIKMTQPTVVYFGPDGGGVDGEPQQLKVFNLTLLYSASQRGQTIESMHVSLHRAESKQNFSVWVYGDDRLVRGSGLHVSPQGVAANHHFLLPSDGSSFQLLAGKYTLRVFAKRVTDSNPILLDCIDLHISESQASELRNIDAGIYFDWGPDQQSYHGHVKRRKPKVLPDWIMEGAFQTPAKV